jgi:hypothetical protein
VRVQLGAAPRFGLDATIVPGRRVIPLALEAAFVTETTLSNGNWKIAVELFVTVMEQK